MILLDTNVLSETAQRRPDPTVIDWLRRFEAVASVPAVVVSELVYGLNLMPVSDHRRPRVEALLRNARTQFEGRILPLDSSVAMQLGHLRSEMRSAGRAIGWPDAAIAATALSRGLTLATRNTKDFAGIEGLRLTNPWTDA